MQTAELIRYIENPNLLDKESVKHLQQLTHDFPYFQSAHVLLSMASKKWDASVYQQSLKKTAIVASNRAHLFRLIHQLEQEDLLEKPTAIQEAKPAISQAETKEEVQQELSILKAAEISTNTESAPVLAAQEKPEVLAEDMLEKEIQNQVVSSFVEKEILKTPDLNKPLASMAPPDSFSDWLALMKKNNAQLSQSASQSTSKGKLKPNNSKSSLKESENNSQTSSLEEKSALEARKLKNKAIIDKIIEKSPGLIRQKEEQKFYTPDIKAKESLIENEHLVTETLARIYALQGNINKAIRAYEILSLKFPQKSAYFATLIQKLKNN